MAIALAACSAGSPRDPEPRTIDAALSNPYKIELSHPLRYTVVWTAGDSSEHEYTMLGGGPIDDKADEFRVELRMPSSELTARLFPTIALYLSQPSAEGSLYRMVETHRPRVVVYEDTNENDHLDLRQNGTTDPDRVLAIDDDYSTMAAIVDLEKMLHELPPSLVDVYYRLTGGRFTPFVPTYGTTDYLYAGHVSATFAYSLDDSGLPLASLRCLRSVSDTLGESVSNVTLDTSVDTALCGLDYANCRSQKLDSVTPPAVTPVRSAVHQRQAFCRRRGAIEALAVTETRFRCEHCTCTSKRKTPVFIAARDAVPPWWPCGGDVDYCESEASLAAFPYDCVEVEEQTEDED